MQHDVYMCNECMPEKREKWLTAKREWSKCVQHDVFMCDECMPEKREKWLTAKRERRKCDCPPPDQYSNKLWCRKCTPGLKGIQARLAKSMSSTLRDALTDRVRHGVPDDHQSMVLPYFWSCGQHDVVMLGDPKYVEHYLSIDPSARRSRVRMRPPHAHGRCRLLLPTHRAGRQAPIRRRRPPSAPASGSEPNLPPTGRKR